MSIKKNRFHVLLVAVVVVACLPLIWETPLTQAAAGAQLYLAPASQSVTNGNNLTLSIDINTNGSSVNAIQSIFSYSATDYSLVSITPGTSFSSFPTTQASGSIQFTAGTTSSVTGTQTVAIVILRAINTGTSAMTLTNVLCSASNNFSNCSAAYDSTTSDNDLSSVTGGSYSVIAPVSNPTPTPTKSKTETTPTKSTTSSTTTTPTNSTTTTDTTPPNISDVKISNITAVSADVSWQTDVAATTVVEYGLNNNFGLTAQTTGLTTDHTVTLSDPALMPDTTYYLQVMSATTNSAPASSAVQQFTTTNLIVTVQVVGSNNKPIEGAKVVVDGQSQVTNSTGTASFQKLPVGPQKVSITANNNVTDHTITVGQINPKSGGYTLQKFTLVATKNTHMVIVYVLLLVVILVVFSALFVPHSPLLLSRFLHERKAVIGTGIVYKPGADKVDIGMVTNNKSDNELTSTPIVEPSPINSDPTHSSNPEQIIAPEEAVPTTPSTPVSTQNPLPVDPGANSVPVVKPPDSQP
ncbi:MAG: hypothetical protein ABSB12_01970 [Candidatus Saccharimonadales bacterium]